MQIRHGTLIDATEGFVTITKYSGDSVQIIKTKPTVYAATHWKRVKEIIDNAPDNLPKGWLLDAVQKDGETA
ncbi:hypothetical protein SDC9_164705 [bioreactor metagenome]|uniref:Uncharacterized protein n=1 Tax=bioreactor metagenome TaxID=1076179 RepID=A0A645FUM9_9ZZZZ